MSTVISQSHTIAQGEPKLIIPALAAFYAHSREFAWLIIRVTAGGMLLVHGIQKVTIIEVAPAHLGRGSDLVAGQTLADPPWHTRVKENSHRQDGC